MKRCDNPSCDSQLTKIRDQDGSCYCDRCFEYENKINNLNGEIFKLNCLITQFTNTAQPIGYYLANNQIQTTSATGDSFWIPNYQVDQVIKDLFDANPELVQLQALERELDHTKAQLQVTRDQLRYLKSQTSRTTALLNNITITIANMRVYAENLKPKLPIQRCEINICLPDDESCHCQFLETCEQISEHLLREADSLVPIQTKVQDILDKLNAP